MSQKSLLALLHLQPLLFAGPRKALTYCLLTKQFSEIAGDVWVVKEAPTIPSQTMRNVKMFQPKYEILGALSGLACAA